MSDIRFIVFDIGNVLLHYDPEIPFRQLIPDDADRAYFLNNVCSPDWNLEQDRGRSWREAEDMLIADHPDHEHLIRAFRANWEDMVPHHFAESVEILESLIDQGFDVTALTNFNDDTFAVAKEKYPFLQRFRGTTVSAEVRLIKPDPAIYTHHQESFGLEPAATLFFDDKEANVEAARSVGWKAEQFVDGAKMRADLQRHGIAV